MPAVVGNDSQQSLLKDLVDYADAQDVITKNFARTGEERHRYLDHLLMAAGYDVTRTWASAHHAAFGTTDVTDTGE